MALRQLYPPLAPYDQGFMDVDGGHSIYYEQSGNPDGRPALFLHGGPGGGGDLDARRFFDPARYRIVVLDQRGCGRSRPHASLESNTTWHLVGDIERLRDRLGIGAWLVFGGSWGSTLALAYAQRHAQAVIALVLRGVFLLRKKELEWFYQHGASEIYPDYWEDFLAPIPAGERDDLLAAYHRRLNSDAAEERLQAARAWSIWEGATSALVPHAGLREKFAAADFALALARIETHYFVNRGFFDTESQLLDGVAAIRDIPAIIVQGRYDVVCPMTSAWELAGRWPEADLRIVATAGHSAYDPAITDALLAATDELAETRTR